MDFRFFRSPFCGGTKVVANAGPGYRIRVGSVPSPGARPRVLRRGHTQFGGLAPLRTASGTDAFDRLDVLVTLVEAYEEDRYDLDEPVDPVDVIEFHLDRLDWTQADLADEADLHRSHLSAVLNRKRSLSLTQIKKISLVLEIPPGRLIDRSDVAPLSA